MTSPGPPAVPARLPCAVVVDGVEVRYGVQGDGGRDLLLVHGSAANHLWWHVVTPLLDAGWRVISVDLSGHGDSGHRNQHSGTTWTAELLAVSRAAGASAPVVAAHSLGGRVALLAAQEHPGALGGLVLLDVGIWPPDRLRSRLGGGPPAVRSTRVHPTREAALARFRLTPEQPPLPREVLAPVAEFSVRPVEGGWTWKHSGQAFPHLYGEEVVHAAATVRVPVAYVTGGASAVVDDALAERARELMPHAVHVRLPGAHHHLPLEVPQRCAELIDQLGRRRPAA